MSKKELTDMQLLFCQEYIKDLNATQAAIRAGYEKHAAGQQACRMLKNVKIQEYVQQLANKRAERVQVDADTILKELLKMSTVDITKAFTDEGWLKPLSDIPDDVRRAISGLEINELFDGQGDDKHIIGVGKKIKFYDKTKSLELLGRHLKLFTDKTEHSGEIGIKVIMEDYSKDGD